MNGSKTVQDGPCVIISKHDRVITYIQYVSKLVKVGA